MKIKQTILTLIALLGFVGLFIAPSDATAATCGGVETSIIGCEEDGQCAAGEDPFEGADPKGVVTAMDEYKERYGHDYGKCKDGAAPSTDIQSSGVWGLLLLVINIMTAGIGILAVAGIVYGSILYASAGGSPENTKKAMGIITNVVIGILAYALMYAVLNFIIPGGLFT